MFPHFRNHTRLGLGIAAAALSGIAAAQPVYSTYTGTSGGSWNVASNWTPTGVPPTTVRALLPYFDDNVARSVDLGGATVDVGVIEVRSTWAIVNGTLRFGTAGSAGLVGEAGRTQLPAVVLDVPASFSGNVEITGGISGSGKLTRRGDTHFKLGGTSTATGGISSVGGEIMFDAGASYPGPIDVSAPLSGGSAALSGTATLGDLLMTFKTYLIPGGRDTVGTLNMANLTLTSLAVYIDIDIGSTGATDRIAITNTLTRGSPDTQVYFSLRGSLPTSGQVIPLLSFGAQSGFSLSNFSANPAVPNAFQGHLVLTANELQYVVDSVPVTLQSFNVD